MEARPAATAKNKIRPPAEAAKDPIITQQKEQAAKSVDDLKAATPDVEARPAATTKQK